MSVNDFRASKKTPIIIVLDNIRSLNNIGSVFRTADCFRIEKIFLCGITAQPPHRDIHKTAIGATESVDWEYRESTVELVKELKANKWKVLAIEQTENSIELQQLKVEKGEQIALVLGNEVDGVQQKVINVCNSTVEIPQFGTKHSLNISVCTGIVVWELFRQLSQFR